MKTIETTCDQCKKVFLRKTGQYKEAKKYKWKQFCSKECLSKSKTTSRAFLCGNETCKKKLTRINSSIEKSVSGIFFCSRKCAAKINNENRRIKGICAYCQKQFYGNRKFCTLACSGKNRRIPKQERQKGVLKRLQEFFKKNGRIPVKKEMYGLYRTARIVFGTWNKAIEMAGYESNPVMFARHFIAKDGHKCDSFTEKIIDDWLYEKSIRHERGFPYGRNKMTADFKIEPNIVIEFFGLAGVQKRYDELVEIKKAECRKLNLRLIEIYPKDIYPKNNLEKIFRNKKIVDFKL